MAKYLVVVESPTKAKTIRKFLPKNYIVEASMGHVRDLPQSATEIPKKYKAEEWSKIGVNVEDSFSPLYVVPKGKSKIVREIKSKLKGVDALYLATDEDREGESISWHLVEILKPKVPIKRMVFHEITKKAINEALKNTRELDEKLVRAQETRRILDRLYGYTLSPLIWKKIAYGLSAGRVQSTGLKMISEREVERMKFVKSDYCDIKAQLLAQGKNFDAKLVEFKGKRVAQGKDFDAQTGKLKKDLDKKVVQLDLKTVKDLADKTKEKDFEVVSVEEKEFNTKPAIPFITSSLQMEGVRKLNMSAKEVMRTAQKLYEEGLITYMRTDSPNLSSEAIQAARNDVEQLYGKEYLSPKVRQFSAKSKGAQEAHEAIRPAGSEFVHPDKTNLDGRQKALYELIWKRTMATQMAEARKASMTVKIQVDDQLYQANGTRIVFPGFLRVYVEGKDDPEAALEDKEVILPSMKKGDSLKAKKLEAIHHETKPPARYTEASLVQRLEKEGIGRPSTYATIIGTIIDRGYVNRINKNLVPSFTGLCVAQFLEKHFPSLVNYNFTSDMENLLDSIADGEANYLDYLKKFYLGKKGLKSIVESQEKDISPTESRVVQLVNLDSPAEIKVGRYGPYIVVGGKGRDEVHASIPEDIAPADLKAEDIDKLIELSKNGPVPIGVHPDNGENIYCLTGRYGPYLQQGEKTDENPKPRRASLPKDLKPADITIPMAVKLLSIPRVVGNHPDTGKEVVVNVGRFGPYIMYNEEFRSLKKDDDVYTVTLDRCVEILAEEKKTRRGSTLIKDLGKHPKKKKNIGLYEGKYGAYLKLGTKNHGLPEELKNNPKALEQLDLKMAVKIIDSADK